MRYRVVHRESSDPHNDIAIVVDTDSSYVEVIKVVAERNRFYSSTEKWSHVMAATCHAALLNAGWLDVFGDEYPYRSADQDKHVAALVVENDMSPYRAAKEHMKRLKDRLDLEELLLKLAENPAWKRLNEENPY